MADRPQGLSRRALARPETGPNDRIVLGQRVSPWLYGYGMFQGSVGSTHSLVLFYAAAGLGLSPAVVGLLDATSMAAMAVGSLLLTFVLARIGNQRLVFALSMGGTGLVTAGFAFASGTVSVLLLAMVFGLCLVAPTVLAPVLASASAPTGLRSRAFSQVNRASASGGAAGIGAAAVWIEGAGGGDAASSMRILFFLLGLLAIVAAVLCYRLLKAGPGVSQVTGAGVQRGEHRPPDQRSWLPAYQGTTGLAPYTDRHGSAAATGRSPLDERSREAGWATGGRRGRKSSAPLLSDELVFFLLLSFVLFAGLGMSFSGVHSYLVTDLRAPVGLAMGAMFGYKVAVFFGAGRFATGRARMVPGQLLGLTGLARAGAVVLISLVGLLPAGLAMPVALAVVSLWGVAGGILAVTGAEIAARLAVPGRWREAMAFYAAWTHAGAIAGAWAGGMVTAQAGFAVMFLVAAALIGLASLRMMRL